MTSLLAGWQVFDRNKDGFISAPEIVATMQELGIHLSDDDVQCMLQAADHNRDGRIDYKGPLLLVLQRLMLIFSAEVCDFE